MLTLFGKYVGTLKEPGFYFVNPLCSAVNPAAKTKLNQSGDVKSGSNAANAAEAAEVANRKRRTVFLYQRPFLFQKKRDRPL